MAIAPPQMFADKRCFHCDKLILTTDRPWFWMKNGGPIIAHQKCFLDWLPRIIADADHIENGEA